MSRSDDIIIGLDAGTSVIKAVAFTTDGRQVGASGVPNKVDYLDDGGAEQDVHRTWSCLLYTSPSPRDA